MSIDPLNDGPALQQSPPGQRPATLHDHYPEQPAASLAAGDQILVSQPVSRTFNDFQSQKEQGVSVAGAIRETDRSLQLLGQKIDVMKAPLEIIVKNYPPFAPQDKARMELLMSYTSIRKEIEQLTFPPPPDVVKLREAVTLPPPISTDASDSQIADHIVKLDATTATLTRMRVEMADRTSAFFSADVASGAYSGSAAPEGAVLGGLMREEDAREKSVQVGRQFAASSGQGVTQQASQFLKVLSQ